VEFDIDEDDGKYCFRKFENGQIKIHELKSRHPNILKSVVVGKKSWGLFLNMWSEGIVDGDFTKHEILEEFNKKGIKIPKPFIIDFENRILKLRNNKFNY